MPGIPSLQSLANVLCLGAHADDIEIGCGGTLLRLQQLNPHVDIQMVVFSGSQERAEEARRSAEALGGCRRGAKVTVEDFRDSYFPYHGERIKEYFECLATRHSPELIFTHYRGDLHQDHRVISELTWNTFRDHLVLEYEVPKYDGDVGRPNVYVHLDEPTCDQKVAHLIRHFRSQTGRSWFSPDTFRAMLRLRGIECRSPSGYAEAFYGRKLILA